MQVPEHLLWEALHELTGGTPRSVSYQPVSGGSINKCFQIRTDAHYFFLKWQDAAAFPDLLKKEARGLELLRQHFKGYIPEVLHLDADEQQEVLILEWIHSGKPDEMAFTTLGEQLASMHLQQGSAFGLDHDNYMGALEQQNQACTDFPSFYITRRLEPLIKKAVDTGVLSSNSRRQLERLGRRLPEMVPDEFPSLIHGDLWSGNVMVNNRQEPVLIDPAVAWSHRECDIAMTALFGGFPDAFYSAYQNTYPLVPGWKQRISLFQLYPLLVHALLFGGTYVRDVQHQLSVY